MQTIPETAPTSEQRNWAMAAHLSALVVTLGIPFGHIVGPLVVLLMKGGESPFVARHAKASLNYQITITIIAFAVILLGAMVLLGFAFVPVGPSAASRTTADAFGAGMVAVWIVAILVAVVLGILSIIWIVMGCLAASDGRPYAYPVSFHFLK